MVRIHPVAAVALAVSLAASVATSAGTYFFQETAELAAFSLDPVEGEVAYPLTIDLDASDALLEASFDWEYELHLELDFDVLADVDLEFYHLAAPWTDRDLQEDDYLLETISLSELRTEFSQKISLSGSWFPQDEPLDLLIVLRSDAPIDVSGWVEVGCQSEEGLEAVNDFDVIVEQ